MFDLFLRNGRIIDGSGQTWYRGGVGIRGDAVTIVRSGGDGVAAGRVIDVADSVICPGFIDMHSHSDLALLSDPRHEAKLRQGVTTELLGMDGLSYAPASPAVLEQLLHYLAAINGAPAPRRPLGLGAGISGAAGWPGRLQRGLYGAPRRDPRRGHGLGRPPAHRGGTGADAGTGAAGDAGRRFRLFHRPNLSAGGPTATPMNWWRCARPSPIWAGFI